MIPFSHDKGSIHRRNHAKRGDRVALFMTPSIRLSASEWNKGERHQKRPNLRDTIFCFHPGIIGAIVLVVSVHNFLAGRYDLPVLVAVM